MSEGVRPDADVMGVASRIPVATTTTTAAVTGTTSTSTMVISATAGVTSSTSGSVSSSSRQGDAITAARRQLLVKGGKFVVPPGARYQVMRRAPWWYAFYETHLNWNTWEASGHLMDPMGAATYERDLFQNLWVANAVLGYDLSVEKLKRMDPAGQLWLIRNGNYTLRDRQRGGYYGNTDDMPMH